MGPLNLLSVCPNLGGAFLAGGFSSCLSMYIKIVLLYFSSHSLPFDILNQRNLESFYVFYLPLISPSQLFIHRVAQLVKHTDNMAYQQRYIQPAIAPNGSNTSSVPIVLFSGFYFRDVQQSIKNSLRLRAFDLNNCSEFQEMFEDIKHKSDSAVREYVQSLNPGWQVQVNLKGLRGLYKHVVRVHFVGSPFRLLRLEYVKTLRLDGKDLAPVPAGMVLNGLTVYNNGGFSGAIAPFGNGQVGSALLNPLAPVFSSMPDGDNFLSLPSSSMANAAFLPGDSPSGTIRSASMPPVVPKPFSSSPPGNPSSSHSTPPRHPPPFPRADSPEEIYNWLMSTPSSPEMSKHGAEVAEWKKTRDLVVDVEDSTEEEAPPLKETGNGWSLGPLIATSEPEERACRWPLAALPAIGFEMWCQVKG